MPAAAIPKGTLTGKAPLVCSACVLSPCETVSPRLSCPPQGKFGCCSFLLYAVLFFPFGQNSTSRVYETRGESLGVTSGFSVPYCPYRSPARQVRSVSSVFFALRSDHCARPPAASHHLSSTRFVLARDQAEFRVFCHFSSLSNDPKCCSVSLSPRCVYCSCFLARRAFCV